VLLGGRVHACSWVGVECRGWVPPPGLNVRAFSRTGRRKHDAAFHPIDLWGRRRLAAPVDTVAREVVTCMTTALDSGPRSLTWGITIPWSPLHPRSSRSRDTEQSGKLRRNG
jgi:hypothetical protein